MTLRWTCSSCWASAAKPLRCSRARAGRSSWTSPRAPRSSGCCPMAGSRRPLAGASSGRPAWPHRPWWMPRGRRRRRRRRRPPVAPTAPAPAPAAVAAAALHWRRCCRRCWPRACAQPGACRGSGFGSQCCRASRCSAGPQLWASTAPRSGRRRARASSSRRSPMTKTTPLCACGTCGTSGSCGRRGTAATDRCRCPASWSTWRRSWARGRGAARGARRRRPTTARRRNRRRRRGRRGRPRRRRASRRKRGSGP
mmetsp:Transcript_59928/g.169820  ORF Transcript_59928/g.169820 Transcript_59928/m.169820 type:complete len:254 (+) Transcript_59928:772-1533(+)